MLEMLNLMLFFEVFKLSKIAQNLELIVRPESISYKPNTFKF